MATAQTIIDNARTDLKIDPGKVIWTDAQMLRYVNAGVSLVYNKTDHKFEFRDAIIDPLTSGERTYTHNADYNRLLWAKLIDRDVTAPTADATSLIGRWEFDEESGTVANDTSSSNLDGTISGAIYVGGMSYSALDFDGTDDNVTVTDNALIQNIFDTGGSISVWINPDSDGENSLGHIIAKTGWGLFIDNETAGNVRIGFDVDFDGATNGQWVTALTNIPLDRWTHVVITYNADAVANDPIIYIDGTAVTITEVTTPVGARVTDAAVNLLIGDRPAGARNFDGTIDEVRIYSRAISASEALDLNDKAERSGQDESELIIVTDTLTDFQRLHDMQFQSDIPKYIYEEEDRLRIWPIPTNEATRRFYIRYKYSEYPDALTLTQEPGFPSHWHYILEHYVRYRCYSSIPGPQNQNNTALALSEWEKWSAKAYNDILHREQERLTYRSPVLPFKRKK